MANESRPCQWDVRDRFDCEGHGQEVQVEHIKAYACKLPASTDKAVIVIHDIFGWQLPNTIYMADTLAANGYRAICPDFFAGREAWKPSDDRSKFNDWLKTRDARKINREADAVLKYLKEQCSAKKLGVITLLEQKLKKNCKVDFEVKIYPGQTHGFVHRRTEHTNPQDKPYIEEESI